MIAHVRQEDPYGCVIACCAMVRGVSYADVAEVLGPPGRGYTRDVWQEHLARHGFATQFLYRVDQIAREERTPWPLSPWADVHLCSVDAGRGTGSHLVVLLGDGTVLDPASDAPRRLSDYGGISYMAAVHQVGGFPGRPQADPPAQRGTMILAVLRDLAGAWGLDFEAATRALPPDTRAFVEAQLPFLPPPMPSASSGPDA